MSYFNVKWYASEIISKLRQNVMGLNGDQMLQGCDSWQLPQVDIEELFKKIRPPGFDVKNYAFAVNRPTY